MSNTFTGTEAELRLNRQGANTIHIILAGSWLLNNDLPDPDSLTHQESTLHNINSASFDTTRVTSWDTGLLIFLARCFHCLEQRGIQIDKSGLPGGIRSLLDMAEAGQRQAHTGAVHVHEKLLVYIGKHVIAAVRGFKEALEFIGEIIESLLRLARGKAHFRVSDLFLIVEQVGPNALPVVSLVSFLVGLILAYMGAAQLERVGAEIYIADLVAIGMVREIAALMTGIIMAGRTGAAFAAELGTMNVNEEIDAYKILGVSIIDFLVLPRILALVSMIPLLTLYSGLVGIVAGMTVSVLVFDFSIFEYYQQTIRALELKQFGVGLFKGTCYGLVVAIAGCLRGLQCGRSAMAVGQSTTSAVVTSIVWIVITASTLTIVFYKLDI